MRKGIICLLIAFAVAFSLTAQGNRESAPITQNPGTMSGVLNVWSSGEELGRFVENFNKDYPNIEVKITVVPNSDFVAKLTPALAGGQGPDIFTGESDYVKYFVNAGVWEDLRKAPYNVDQYTDDMWQYVRSVGTDASGSVRALSWQASPGSLIYRRDLAQKVFGVSEPEDVAKLLDSNQAMLKAAAAFKTQGIKMFASWEDIMNMQFSNRKAPWVQDGKLIIDPSMLEFMDMAKTITNNGYDLGVSPWAPEWMAAVEGNDCFCYVLPTWGYQFVVKPSASNTIGKWGLSQGAVPYVKGGTWLGINKDSKQKDLAWAFLRYVTLDSEAQIAYAKQYGEYVSLKSADTALAAGLGEEVLAGQNLFAFYNDQMAKIPSDLMTAYDGQLNNAFLSTVRSYATGMLTKDAAVNQFKEDAKTAYPELSL
ncbi:ABC-type sugar transport system, periplasmic component [Sphaerochaeta pleomorpha str. Grapes]|uniref:ABC-type sugar transport system, periplasmic component n=1 Tax=Sphaerochaeta pleomorpha (strain ATCC BAA-1885 / DSM 22778 / Grapes) TaxID=158190 RepID=G8QXB9_SPHPG|nr:ABC transporter substrate-binding protein [Sphaerochaeta pleomorpha]AEV28420.1 ABC-type sugar transport system, periplasmic component [Sphaerochaeta pleomorpha str. Grapes]